MARPCIIGIDGERVSERTWRIGDVHTYLADPGATRISLSLSTWEYPAFYGGTSDYRSRELASGISYDPPRVSISATSVARGDGAIINKGSPVARANSLLVVYTGRD